MTKTCQNPACGKELVRRDWERVKDWEKRTTCDRYCFKILKRVEKWKLLEARRKCEVCDKKLYPTIAKNGKAVAPRTCRSKACMDELRLRTRAQRLERVAEASARTWTDPAGNIHTLPSNIALREEYKASIKRRIKRGEGVQMIGNVRVYDGPVTRVAA